MKKLFIQFVFPLVMATCIIKGFVSCRKDPIVWSKALERGPYLQMLGSDKVTINWKTHYEVPGIVVYGESPYDLNQKVQGESVNEHSVTITGLKPSTRYYYAIESEERKLQGDSSNYFITGPGEGTSKKVQIWVSGDAGSGNAGQNSVRDALISSSRGIHPDLWLWMGDNAYEHGTEEEYQDHIFTNHFESLMKNICVWPAIGNHDCANKGYQSHASRNNHFPYYSIFSLPQNGESGGAPSGKEKYYAFNYSNIHFICLDSYASYNDPSSEMYQWLKNDLSVNRKKWTIVFFHHPPYSKGGHNSDTDEEMINMRANILPLLEQYSVDLVLSGHSHTYERSYLLYGHYGAENSLKQSMILDQGSGKEPAPYVKSGKGTVYVVTGSAGKSGGMSPGYPHDAMFTSYNTVMGAMILEVEGETLHARFVDSSNNTRDEFAIKKY